MGATQSAINSQLESQLAGVKSEIKPKKLRAVHQQVLFEYPFLANIFESMLICDNRIPDCPIVYCNDLFEQMTCYPKEEIIGRNCRFLQGADTDKNIVKAIRKAVDEGLELEVEILNYRKDGVPFYNVFLMLPIHAPKKRDGPVQYFLAIQKDITILRQPGSDPREWSAAEVGMWLYHSGLPLFITPCMESGINGEKLFKLNDSNLEDIVSESTLSERRVVLTKIRDLASNPGRAFAGIDVSKIKDFDYHQPQNEEENIRLGKEKVDIEGSRPWWRSIGSKSKGLDDEEKKSLNSIGVSDPYSNIKDICSGNLVTVKVFYKKKITVIQVPETITYSMLLERFQDMTLVPVKCKYKDLDGDWVSIEDDDSVEAAFLCTKGGTVSIKVSKKFKPLSQEKQIYLQALPVGIVVMDAESTILFMNNFAQILLELEPHEFMRRTFSQAVGNLDITNVGDYQTLTTHEEKEVKAFISPDRVDFNHVILISK